MAIFFSLLIISFFLEIALRVLPLKGIEFKAGKFDEDLSLYVYEPSSTLKLTNIRGERITRSVNKSGFLDINHKLNKEKKVFRVGFFGDSYVEANQVLLKDTFFRIINNKLSKNSVEILAFGNSGWGTIHSYLVSKKFSLDYSLDLVVYVFTENDLGDQVYDLKKVDSLPYPILNEDNKVLIDKTKVMNFVKNRSKYSFFEFFYRKSSLLQNTYRRYKMLLKYGVKTSVKEEDMTMSSTLVKNKFPNPNDLPSTWPENYKISSKEIFKKMIKKWNKEILESGKEFVIMYVPRESEWKKPDKEQDSWKYWLETFSINNNIQFIDPTESFFKKEKMNAEIYDDHFSKIGHIAFAEAFINWFNKDK